MAMLLAKSNAEPMPWTSLKAISVGALGARAQSIEPIVKTTNPSVYSFTLPTMSANRPMPTSSIVVTSL